MAPAESALSKVQLRSAAVGPRALGTTGPDIRRGVRKEEGYIEYIDPRHVLIISEISATIRNGYRMSMIYRVSRYTFLEMRITLRHEFIYDLSN